MNYTAYREYEVKFSDDCGASCSICKEDMQGKNGYIKKEYSNRDQYIKDGKVTNTEFLCIACHMEQI